MLGRFRFARGPWDCPQPSLFASSFSQGHDGRRLPPPSGSCHSWLTPPHQFVPTPSRLPLLTLFDPATGIAYPRTFYCRCRFSWLTRYPSRRALRTSTVPRRPAPVCAGCLVNSTSLAASKTRDCRTLGAPRMSSGLYLQNLPYHFYHAPRASRP